MIFANVAIPTLVPHLLAAVLLLPAVAAIEALVIRRSLLVRFEQSFQYAFAANWRSTLVGLPLGYAFAVIGVIPAGFFSPLIPEGSRELYSMSLFSMVMLGGTIPNEAIPVAEAIGQTLLLIPYFFASVFIEKRYLLRVLPEIETRRVRATTWKMNGVTYLCFFVFALANLIVTVDQYSNTNSAKNARNLPKVRQTAL